MFLLLGADYYGTLAAVRCLGRQKVPVFVADDNKKARALYSRYVTERHVAEEARRRKPEDQPADPRRGRVETEPAREQVRTKCTQGNARQRSEVEAEEWVLHYPLNRSHEHGGSDQVF